MHYEENNICLYLMDNMELMSKYPDNYFELAICDPPYGIKIGGSGKITDVTQYKDVKWDDNIPSQEYFKELFRISKNQIIWGGNYFAAVLTPTNSWIVWDKKQKNDWNDNFSDGEIAWTSFNNPLRIFRHLWMGALRKKDSTEIVRIHPTQKPVKLYTWLLSNYAKKGDKILDTHLGSGSIAIACDKMGFELTACEIDKDYFNGAVKRLKHHQDQFKLF